LESKRRTWRRFFSNKNGFSHWLINSFIIHSSLVCVYECIRCDTNSHPSRSAPSRSLDSLRLRWKKWKRPLLATVCDLLINKIIFCIWNSRRWLETVFSDDMIDTHLDGILFSCMTNFCTKNMIVWNLNNYNGISIK